MLHSKHFHICLLCLARRVIFVACSALPRLALRRNEGPQFGDSPSHMHRRSGRVISLHINNPHLPVFFRPSTQTYRISSLKFSQKRLQSNIGYV